VTADDASDPVMLGISRLTVLTPDVRRAALLRERCRARMRHTPKRKHALGPALFSGLCVLYLAALLLDVLRLQGVL
jgi:hypothetical protein